MPENTTSPRPVRWPWALLFLALAWSILIRWPLILNAEDHLDSDLAVDGLTLLDATRGHWRWHYPGTPHIGSVPVLFSWPQSMAFGVDARTLVSGGTVLYAFVLVTTFLLAWRAFGPRVAAWSLVPLALSSAGVIWLSGRITGGHLLAAGWHAGSFWLLGRCLAEGGEGNTPLQDRASPPPQPSPTREEGVQRPSSVVGEEVNKLSPLVGEGRVGGRAVESDRQTIAIPVRRAILLGLWCGFGFYIDSMLIVTLAALIPAAILGWWTAGRSRRGLVLALAFGTACAIGTAPRWIGERVEPHDAYREQFEPIRDPTVLAGHASILFGLCLPRLIGGHALPNFGPEPAPSSLAGRGPSTFTPPPPLDPLAGLTTLHVLGLFVVAIIALAFIRMPRPDPGRLAVRFGLLFASVLVIAGFIMNRNIFNSDNYRYLVFLLTPWALGFGLLMDRVSRKGAGGAVAAGLVTLIFAGLLTVDVWRWYRGYGWIDEHGRPVQVAPSDPALAWFRAHPEAKRIYGDYWDVYRLAFLAGGRLRPTPIAIYPDRFPELKTTGLDDEVYLVARGVRSAPMGWTEPTPLPGARIYRWPWSKSPGHRQPWEQP